MSPTARSASAANPTQHIDMSHAAIAALTNTIKTAAPRTPHTLPLPLSSSSPIKSRQHHESFPCARGVRDKLVSSQHPVLFIMATSGWLFVLVRGSVRFSPEFGPQSGRVPRWRRAPPPVGTPLGGRLPGCVRFRLCRRASRESARIKSENHSRGDWR